MGSHGHRLTDEEAAALFEPSGWEERYSSEEKIWSGNANPQLVVEVSWLTPGTALDVGCGEGGDVIWLARQAWRVTGADFDGVIPANPAVAETRPKVAWKGQKRTVLHPLEFAALLAAARTSGPNDHARRHPRTPDDALRATPSAGRSAGAAQPHVPGPASPGRTVKENPEGDCAPPTWSARLSVKAGVPRWSSVSIPTSPALGRLGTGSGSEAVALIFGSRRPVTDTSAPLPSAALMAGRS